MIPVADLRCPLCGGTIKWTCGSGAYTAGHADCERGRNVSRRYPEGDYESCLWKGTRLVRSPLLGVVTDGPVSRDAYAAPTPADLPGCDS